jgi:putative glycolipid-binding protein
MLKHHSISREIVWTGIRNPSLDYCYVKEVIGGWNFSGIIVARLPAGPFGARYEILLDRSFKTRSLTVEKMTRGKTSLTSTSKRVPSPTPSRSDALR